jgi:hypothetical protein
MHKDAPKAAEAAQCAGDQRRFWLMHDMLFANQKSLTPADLKRYAQALELDGMAFGQCMDSDKYAGRVRDDRALGEKLGVAATPATFINGRLVPGAVGIEQFVSVIDEELDLKSGGRPRPRPRSCAPCGSSASTAAATALNRRETPPEDAVPVLLQEDQVTSVQVRTSAGAR